MKHIDEYRDRAKAKALVDRIRAVSTKDVSIMEICGTHTHSISRYGIRQALPGNIKLISGPGCPVCVTSESDIERIIEFSRGRRDIIIATFGDMMRVPGKSSSLEEERSRGADIRVVYSPLNALEFALRNPDKEVLLYAVGFETTAPTVAATIIMAKDSGVTNYSVLSLHKLTPPAMKALLDTGDMRIDGFICPGHVTAIIGADAYAFLADEYGSPCVVAGFEPIDALTGIYMLVLQFEEGRREIEIEYRRVVSRKGNRKAKSIMAEVFEDADASWRGIGTIPLSGLAIKREYSAFDAGRKFSIPLPEAEEPRGCRCGDVLKGLITPPECALFANVCNPEAPRGPCMVSSEGTCSAFYKYERIL